MALLFAVRGLSGNIHGIAADFCRHTACSVHLVRLPLWYLHALFWFCSYGTGVAVWMFSAARSGGFVLTRYACILPLLTVQRLCGCHCGVTVYAAQAPYVFHHLRFHLYCLEVACRLYHDSCSYWVTPRTAPFLLHMCASFDSPYPYQVYTPCRSC